MIQVIVVDDHDLFRVLLKDTLNSNYTDITVAGDADCGASLLRLLPDTPADVLLLDINLPDMDATEITKTVRRDYPAMKILAISAENTTQTVVAMVEAGISGFISKQRGATAELVEAIRSVAAGEEYFGRDISSILFDVYVSKKKTAEPTAEFTKREREIILACRDGLLCKEIAQKLGVSYHTVKAHKNNIFQKLGINNAMEMVNYAMKKGII